MADGSIVKEAALRYQRRRPRPLIPVSRDESMEQSESSTTPVRI